MEEIDVETWQDVICVLAAAALMLAFCSGVKAVCRKILKREGLE